MSSSAPCAFARPVSSRLILPRQIWPRTALLALLAVTSVAATGCLPGSLLGIGGDSGGSSYTPDYSAKAPAHRTGLPCADSDPTHLCVAVKVVSYQDSAGRPILSQAQAQANLSGVNQLWSQCHVQFTLESYQAVAASSFGLPYSPTEQDALADVRSTFENSDTLLVTATGQWSGTLGAGAANAWTELPATGPFGVVMEASVSSVSGLLAHELGHYLDLQHTSDVYNVMNPTVFANSINIIDSQCSTARATAISFWGAALR